MVYSVSGDGVESFYNISTKQKYQAYDLNGEKLISGTSLRVLNYNVGQYYIGNGNPIPEASKAEYSALQTIILDNIKPNICCMQEATAIFCDDGTSADTFLSTWFDTFKTSRGSIGYQAHKIATNGISISDYEEIAFENAVGNYPGYEKCYITVGGNQICIINTHNTTDQTLQEEQCAEILAAVENEERFIICGDFNTVITSINDTDYNNCIKPFVVAGYNTANCGEFGVIPTYYDTDDPTASYHSATDMIITSANILITFAASEKTKLSDGIAEKIDHLPIYADLEIH